METIEFMDERNYERCLNHALNGCQVFDFGVTDLRELRIRLYSMPSFSIHAPLPTPDDYPGSASTSFLLDPDPDKRRATLDMLRRTVDVAAQWGAQYVVVHFGGLHSDGLSKAEIVKLAHDAAAQLDTWGQERGVPLHIEYAAYNPGFSLPQELAELVSGYEMLDICLDVGHARVGALMLGLDEWEVFETLAPYTRSMHLWTMRTRQDVRRYRHTPVHPTLTPAGGWIDVPRVLDLVLRHNPTCDLVFEIDSIFEPDRGWQVEGEEWVRGLVAPYKGEGHRAEGS
jgi:sugar phosphate isomerase/epimerase